jgi:hypothetical protein
MGDVVLALQEPGDKVVAQEHRVARSGPTSVGTTRPVSVDDELRRRDTTKKQVVVGGALEVVKNALHTNEMALTRVVHVKVYMLNCVDVRPDEGEVPDGPNQATVGNWAIDRVARVEDVGECPPMWCRACSRSCQRTQGYQERTNSAAGKGCCVAAPRRRSRSGGGETGPTW